ncbi:MAG: glycosyltransferase [Myxococcota bacterium]
MTWLVTIWALCAAGFTAVALFRLRRRRTLAREPGAPRIRRWPHVLLLRPVDAPTPLELENLASPVDYSGPLTHVVLSPFRPRLASANVEWLPSDPLSGNRKVGHLAYALATLPRAADSVVLCVDADVRVDGALVASLVDELRGGAALASAAPRPEVQESMAGRMVRGLLVQSHHSFEALDVMSAGARAVCGKALALSREAQALLPALADCIGEDLELSSALYERGLPVTLARAPAVVPQAPDASPRAVLERFARWMQVLRAHRPALFPSVPLLFAPTPLLMVLASWLAAPQAAVALCLLVGARIALANRLDGRPGLRFEWLLAELLLLTAWLDALRRGRIVTWRGRRFALSKGGRMVAQLAPVEGGTA